MREDDQDQDLDDQDPEDVDWNEETADEVPKKKGANKKKEDLEKKSEKKKKKIGKFSSSEKEHKISFDQTSANQGPDLRFVFEAISKPLIPKSSRSSKLETQNCGYTNPNF